MPHERDDTNTISAIATRGQCERSFWPTIRETIRLTALAAGNTRINATVTQKMTMMLITTRRCRLDKEQST